MTTRAPAADAPPLLEARGLVFSYDDIPALDGIDLAVRPGVNLAVLGQNGSGKSTLFFHLNGTLKPARGEVRRDGLPIQYDHRGLTALRRRVGLVLQNPDDQLFAATVGQDVSFGPMNLGLGEAEARERTLAAMRELDIEDLADRPTHQLSFGQKKRVVLAGVMAMSPEALLLDEPTAGLDSGGVDELLDSLAGLRERGVTIVVATHDVNFAWRWADEAAVLRRGRVAARGTMEEIFANEDAESRLGLRRPTLLALGRLLVERGTIAAGSAMPRTLADLERLLAAKG